MSPTELGGRVVRCLTLGAASLAVYMHSASADSLLGAYVGAAAGQGQVTAGVPYSSIVVPQAAEFRDNHLAYELMAGLRPISFLGAELQYVDLGHPSAGFYGYPADASVKAAAAFGILYFPVPVIDIYAKAGVARLQSDVSGFLPTGGFICTAGAPCGTLPFRLDRTTSGFALGAGAQYHIGSLAIRAEYERFDAAGANPSVAAIGVTWTFL